MRRHDAQVLGAAAFGERVTKALARLAAGLEKQNLPLPTQKWLWGQVRRYDPTIRQDAVSRWMNGKAMAELPRVLALARVLGVEPGWLLFGEEGCKRPSGVAEEAGADLATAPRPDEPARVPGKRSAGRRRSNER